MLRTANLLSRGERSTLRELKFFAITFGISLQGIEKLKNSGGFKKKVDLGEYYAIQKSYSKVATVFRISKKEFNEEEEELTIGESERKVVSS